MELQMVLIRLTRKIFSTKEILHKEIQLISKIPTLGEEDQLKLRMLVKPLLIVNGDTVRGGFNETK